jgi:type II secretory pathway pseudopilin PulG
MMVDATQQRRFRLSVRSLMIAVAIFALVLALVIGVAQQAVLLHDRRLRAIAAEQLARAAADQAQVEAQARALLAQLDSTVADVADHPEVGSPAKNGIRLWAVLGMNHAVFRRGEAKGLNIEFTLVNDGDTSIDPKIGESKIVVNGKELAGSALILGNGPRDARFEALPPGEHLQFGYALGDYFKEPGIYRVSWQGEHFQTPEIVFRVLPAEAN